jgi:tRNA A-37 threonylcarbamoyl transferase component Bud32
LELKKLRKFSASQLLTFVSFPWFEGTLRAWDINLEMIKNIVIPPSYALIRRGKTSLLIKEEYKDTLMRRGIDDIESFIDMNRPGTKYLAGRTSHPSIPIDGDTRVVIRRYSHGGLFRKFTRDLFLSGARSFQELALTEEIRSCGIPTVQPIGAIHHSALFPLYRAYLLSLEVPHCKDLIQYLKDLRSLSLSQMLPSKRRIIGTAAVLLIHFHQAGFFHRDLQLKNMLVADERVLLIDFDRSYRKGVLSIRERVGNLLRLNRSVEKWARLGLPITWRDRMRFFSIYAGNDAEIREAMRKALRTYTLRSLLHRIGWVFEKK